MKDILIVVADKNMLQTLKGLLERPEALCIRRIEADIYDHPQRDPACALRGVEFMASYSTQYRHGLLIFDHQGSGKEQTPPQELQMTIDQEFSRSSWGTRGKAIVLSPELEVWVWGGSPHVSRIAGWDGGTYRLRKWLLDQGHLKENEMKPAHPKEAFEAALYESRTPRSSSLYLQLARAVSLKRCSDAGFLEFKKVLKGWFPPP